jgi:hypothetical protein
MNCLNIDFPTAFRNACIESENKLPSAAPDHNGGRAMFGSHGLNGSAVADFGRGKLFFSMPGA